ncbi:MAG: hypothetical protein P4L99_25535 [Chthoniobacter sp.]|nr:hypothetical protein [Chthoniobacter sp.]
MLTSNLLVHVTCGSVVIERGRQRVDVDRGGACLVSPGELIVTEVPDRLGLIVNSWTFFSDRVIGKVLKPIQGLENWVAMVRPLHQGLYPFASRDTKFWASQAHRPAFADGFKPAFRQLVHTCTPSVFMFLVATFYSRARELNIWLETLLLSGLTTEQLQDAYPGGRRLFHLHWATYQSLSLKTWLRRRKMQLAAVWICHGDAGLVAIRSALGYTSASSFSADYEREQGIAPKAETRLEDGRKLPLSDLQCKLRPFWHQDEAEARQRLGPPNQKSEAGSIESATVQTKSCGGSVTEKLVAGVSPPPENEKGPDLHLFWQLKSTAALELFAA